MVFLLCYESASLRKRPYFSKCDINNMALKYRHNLFCVSIVRLSVLALETFDKAKKSFVTFSLSD